MLLENFKNIRVRDKVWSCASSAIMQLHVSVARVFAPRQSFFKDRTGS